MTTETEANYSATTKPLLSGVVYMVLGWSVICSTISVIDIYLRPAPAAFPATPKPLTSSLLASDELWDEPEGPPVLIDQNTGCEWIGSSWDTATPRIGSDGATICKGKSTGRPPVQ